MFSFVVAQAVVAGVKSLEKPLERLEAALAIMAGEAEGKERQAIHLDIYVTKEELEAILAHPEVLGAVKRAVVAKNAGAVPTCECCGATT